MLLRACETAAGSRTQDHALCDFLFRPLHMRQSLCDVMAAYTHAEYNHAENLADETKLGVHAFLEASLGGTRELQTRDYADGKNRPIQVPR